MSYRRCFYAVFLLILFSLTATVQSSGQIGGGGCEDGCDPPPPPPPPPPPDLTFNAVFYESIYPDIQNVYGNNLTAATQHYNLFGLPAGRRGGIIFDPVYYLATYPDLRQVYGTNYQAAAQHFIYQGLPVEGRRGSLEFDVQYYLANNPDLVAAFGSTGYIAAAQHFLSTGLVVEGRRGSADVDIKAYINNYPDVATALGGTAMGRYIDPMLHWLRRGKQFGRQATGTLVTTTDCTSTTPPAGYTRVYIGIRSDGLDGSGATAADPRNGDLLDSILRGYTGDPLGGIPTTDHLIVCLGPGTYHTDGYYNWVIDVPHNTQTIQNKGFALGPHWHIHGSGMNQTTVQLQSFYLPPPGGEPGMPPTGSNVVFGTLAVMDVNPGDEISDMTIDDNFPNLKAQAGSLPLRLDAIYLRDNIGQHYIHHVNVINAASEGPPHGESFPISIVSVAYTPNPAAPPGPPSQDNTIEFVTMSQWTGPKCTAIIMAYATGAIQYNVVNGYQIAYGGWEMPLVPASGGNPNKFVYIHDNFAFNTQYGVNIDSNFNDAVNIQFNWIDNPQLRGMVIGGNGANGSRFDSFSFLYNTIEGGGHAIDGIIFQGAVTNAVLTRTNFVNDGAASGHALSVFNYNNAGNVFQYNQIDGTFGFTSDGHSPAPFCIYGNWDQNGAPRSDVPNTQSTPCRPGL